MLFTLSPIISYAQYYNSYNYYNPLNITTTNATNITSVGVTLNGQVNGSNLYSTYNVETWFEYGTNTNFGYSTVHINSNSGYANYSSNVANLSSNTIYYFRAIAQGGQGVVYGNTNSFRTNFGNIINNTIIENNVPLNPSVITNEATSIGSKSVKLNALVNNSADYSARTWFEWGATPTLANSTPMVYLGTLNSAKHINTITGLAPSTTYYFRAVVQYSSSKVNGNTLSFTTNKAVVTQENATENTTNTTPTNTENVKNTTTLEPSLAASAVGAGSSSFLPGNITGWLLLILLVLILILLSKRINGEFTGSKPVKDSNSSGHGH